MMEHDSEPVRGLPGPLPAGEHIVWQGAPDAWVFARSALKTRWIAAYFAAFGIYALMQGSLLGAAITIGTGLACLAFLYLFAWGVARTSVYTLTNKRIVLRIGVALSACFNLPLKTLASAGLRPLERGRGDIALAIEGGRIGYLFLWPHARPWRLKEPEPMLRAVPDAQTVAALLAKARAAVGPVAHGATAEPAATRPVDLVLGAAA